MPNSFQNSEQDEDCRQEIIPSSLQIKRLRNGIQLKALPGQGQHKFIIAIAGEIQQQGEIFSLQLKEGVIPLTIPRMKQLPLETCHLPIQSTVGFYPKVVDGRIVEARLLKWGYLKSFIHCQGFVIPKFKMLVIQRDFTRWGKQARDYLHTFKTLPKDCPAGFYKLQCRRHGLDIEVIHIIPVSSV